MAIRLIDGSPGLIIDEGGKRYLVLSDLHIGLEDEVSEIGIHLPSMLSVLLSSVNDLIDKYSPSVLVLLGDVKHRVAGVSWREAKKVKEFVETVRPRIDEIIIAPGNHDVGIYSLTEGAASVVSSRGFSIGDKWLLHGHTWPHPDALLKKMIIIGHTHPILRMIEDGASIKQRVYLLLKTRRSSLYKALMTRPGYSKLLENYNKRGIIKLLVMPHFNPASGGVDVKHLFGNKLGSPLLRTNVFPINDAYVLSLGGVIINSVEEIVAKNSEAS